MKSLLKVYSAPTGHWVGDGFPVRTIFSYQSLGEAISPFVMNTKEEIRQAMRDYQSGRMGALP